MLSCVSDVRVAMMYGLQLILANPPFATRRPARHHQGPDAALKVRARWERGKCSTQRGAVSGRKGKGGDGF